MKKFIVFLIILSMCASLAACSTEQENQPSTSVSATVGATGEATQPDDSTGVRQLPMFSVSLPIATQTTTAEDGTEIFNYSYQSISLIGPEADIADSIILNFLNHIDSTVASANSMKEFAVEQQKISENWNPYFYEIIYRPVRLDPSVLSLYGRIVTFSGGAHPETHFSSINYDLTNGNVLKLTDVLVADTSAETISNAVIKALTEIKTEEQLYEGFEDFVLERFTKSLGNDRSWHLDANGLTFFFSPYEIATYASGDVSVTIRYSDLVGVLKDEYFPVETEDASGEISAEIFSDDLINNFNQFSEIIIDENSQKFILFTDSYVRDITLYTGTWSPFDDSFVADNEIFYATSLTPGDAVLVESALNGEFPSLYLKYNTNGKTVEKMLMLDKLTGGIKLIDA